MAAATVAGDLPGVNSPLIPPAVRFVVRRTSASFAPSLLTKARAGAPK